MKIGYFSEGYKIDPSLHGQRHVKLLDMVLLGGVTEVEFHPGDLARCNAKDWEYDVITGEIKDADKRGLSGFQVHSILENGCAVLIPL